MLKWVGLCCPQGVLFCDFCILKGRKMAWAVYSRVTNGPSVHNQGSGSENERDFRSPREITELARKGPLLIG